MTKREVARITQKGIFAKSIGAVSIAIATALTLFYAVRYPVATAFFFSIATYASLAMLAFLLYACLIAHRMTCRGDASPKMLFGILFVAVMLALAAEFLTLVGAPVSTPFDFSDWSKKRILVFFLLLVATQMLYLFRLPKEGNEHSLSDVSQDSGVLHVLAARSSIRFTLISVVAFVGVALVLSGVIGSMLSVVTGRIAFLVFVTVGGVAVLAFMSFGVARKPELVFLSLCLLSGSFLVFALPPTTAISWDDQIHYDRALGLSYLGHSEFSEADRLLVFEAHEAIDQEYDSFQSHVDRVNDVDIDADASSEYFETIGFSTPVRGVSLADVSTVGYFPSAIALWLGRLLGLPLLCSVIFGRLGNLISYSVVIALAIRISPLKKGVMATIGLLPTSIFLASNYSYDPVVISFLMLAVALIMRELYSPNKLLTAGSMLSIVAALFIGLAPKAIYFPVIGLLFLMPRSKFSSKESHRKFIACVVLFGLVMVCSFILPMLFSASAQAGDSRGGSDVSASGQIAYILTHPVEYAQTLGAFMLGYLSPSNADMYSVSYAYMGFLPAVVPWVSSLAFACLLSVTFIDVSTESSHVLGFWGRAWVALLFALSVVLVCTALYVSFTPVGYGTINGCQARYLTPLLICCALVFPAFNAGGNVSPNSSCTSLPSTSQAPFKLGSAVMFLMSALCSLSMVAFW